MSAEPPLAGGWRERLAQLPGGSWIWLALGALILAGAVALAVTKARPAPSAAHSSDPAPSAEVASGEEPAKPEPEKSGPPAPAAQPELAAVPQPNPEEAPATARADAGALSATVRIVFKTYPPRRASVMWGSQRLGFIERGKPLVVERPRDSGPMDVVVRAPGFIPVHTRAFTFDDAVVDVRITLNEKKDTIYGYQQPLPPEPADAGAPP